MIEAVVFDLDGVLIESEQVWDAVRRQYAADHGGRWSPEATRAMQGMSAPEWSAYLRDSLGVALDPEDINHGVVGQVAARYRERLPLVPGADDAVRRMAAVWPLALASSSDRVLIDEVLWAAGLADAFAVTVSSEEVAHGKPAPDVYLEAARRLGCPAAGCVAVEDSTNGLRSAHRAGMRLVALPNRAYPPPPDALALADIVLQNLDQLTVAAVQGLDAAVEAHLDEEEDESFPASDPHSDWAG